MSDEPSTDNVVQFKPVAVDDSLQVSNRQKQINMLKQLITNLEDETIPAEYTRTLVVLTNDNALQKLKIYTGGLQTYEVIAIGELVISSAIGQSI